MWIVTILSTLSIGIVKCSAILLYRRIFTISRIFNYYTTVLLVLIVTWTLAFLTASIFQCGTHPAAAWTNREKLQKYCYDTSKATTTRALTNVIMDLIIVVSPMPIVWRMKMTMVRKLQVTAIFATGFMYDLIACLFSLTDTWQSSRCRHSQSIYSTPGLTRFKCAWISRSSR
jgi:hypothetical protein